MRTLKLGDQNNHFCSVLFACFGATPGEIAPGRLGWRTYGMPGMEPRSLLSWCARQTLTALATAPASWIVVSEVKEKAKNCGQIKGPQRERNLHRQCFLKMSVIPESITGKILNEETLGVSS